eukprot:IDg9218t1
MNCNLRFRPKAQDSLGLASGVVEVICRALSVYPMITVWKNINLLVLYCTVSLPDMRLNCALVTMAARAPSRGALEEEDGAPTASRAANCTTRR